MAEESLFSCSNFALLRAPVHPTTRSSDTCCPVAEGADDEEGALVDYLRAVTSDPLVREAVAVSSPSLTRSLDAILSGRPARLSDLRRMSRAVTAYRLRMATRATPFGLMAGVTAAEFVTDPADVKVRFGHEHRRSARVDQGWLMGLVTDWERRPEVLRGLSVAVNNLCFVRNGRLVLPYVPGNNAGSKMIRDVTVRCSPAVRAVLDLARRPVRGADLERNLAAAFPQAPGAAIMSMLVQLVSNDFLLTDLRPPLETAEPLEHVIDALGDLPQAAQLRQISHSLAGYAATSLGAGGAEWEALTRQMRQLRDGDRFVQVDLVLDLDARLPASVTAEVERAATLLWRIAPATPAVDALGSYYTEFVERYGLGRSVGLQDLLDPNVGLGAPAGYRAPASLRPAPAPAQPDWQRGQFLTQLAQEALLDARPEVELTEEHITRLAHDGNGVPPATAELFAQLSAESPKALQSGDFRLVVIGGTPSAGAAFGRFAALLPEQAQSGLADLARSATPGALAAQLVFQPLDARSANVTRVPQWLDHRLPVAVFSDPDAPNTLDLDDLAVCADHRRLFVVQRSTGREVVPAVFHALNTHYQAPNAARLLGEIATSGTLPWGLWSWGLAETLPYLPRVRHSRTILSLARWRPGKDLRDQRISTAEWTERWRAWRARWRVPNRVRLSHSDHRIDLDLDQPLHLSLLRAELGRHSDAVLLEVFGAEGGDGWLAGPGGPHRNELVFPLTLADPGRRPTASRPVVPRRPADAEHLPGGEWLYACVYCTPDLQNELLTTRLPRLLAELPEEVDRWFFLRYSDGEHHLRLRFHGTGHALGAKLLPLLNDWASGLRVDGVSRRLMLDTYYPELERYGGPGAIEAVERVFHADSIAALVDLRARTGGGDSPELALLAAAGYVDMARAFLTDEAGDGEPPWVDWLLTTLNKSPEHEHFRRCRREAIALIDPYGPPDARPAWALRAAALTAYARTLRELGTRAWAPPLPVLQSLLHMHHNRLVSADSAAERRSYALARGAVQAHHDRRRNSR